MARPRAQAQCGVAAAGVQDAASHDGAHAGHDLPQLEAAGALVWSNGVEGRFGMPLVTRAPKRAMTCRSALGRLPATHLRCLAAAQTVDVRVKL